MIRVPLVIYNFVAILKIVVSVVEVLWTPSEWAYCVLLWLFFRLEPT